MAKFEGNSQAEEFGYDALLLGGNQFETAVLVLGAGESAGAGTVLAMDPAGGAYKVAGAAPEGALAVLVDNGSFKGAGNFAVRVCIAGRVSRPALSFAGSVPTDVQAAALRDYGILAVAVEKCQ